eukprot:GHVN01017588.1.p1 GENE.GHVN01017588.1~~GHVN01017588.1.p1  ORF type:complete len:358 (+),score=50.24 GHVN01017588.1:40-1113(+)
MTMEKPNWACFFLIFLVETVAGEEGGVSSAGLTGWAFRNVGKATLVAAVTTLGLKWLLNRPSRNFTKPSDVAKAYDDWSNEQILEHYWGEHIHLGYYNEEERAQGPFKKDFKQAKYDFVTQMMRFGEIADSTTPLTVLDVGCGIGGTTRILGKNLPNESKVTGITISECQKKRAEELTDKAGLKSSCQFDVMDAMDMQYPDSSFDVVWVCESTEHMDDKKKAVSEFIRVLKPGGRLILAAWCQRDETHPFSQDENNRLSFLYDQWCHPPFISIERFTDLLTSHDSLHQLKHADWTTPTIASWYHQLYLGLVDPLPWMKRPSLIWKNFKDGWCLHKMHQAFRDGLMVYGLITCVKSSE